MGFGKLFKEASILGKTLIILVPVSGVTLILTSQWRPVIGEDKLFSILYLAAEMLILGGSCAGCLILFRSNLAGLFKHGFRWNAMIIVMVIGGLSVGGIYQAVATGIPAIIDLSSGPVTVQAKYEKNDYHASSNSGEGSHLIAMFKTPDGKELNFDLGDKPDYAKGLNDPGPYNITYYPYSNVLVSYSK